jgi:ubiquinone/menaquinone biosynthesis C-methylase UbiE
MRQLIKKYLPKPLHHLYNRLVSKGRIRALYGEWFELEWKRKARAANPQVWREVYDLAWEHATMQDLTPLDLGRIEALVPEAASVLDVGCGDGYLLHALAGKGRKLTGMDISEVAIRKANARLADGAALLTGVVERLPFPDQAFDVVISAHTLEHVLDPDKAVNELTRVCKGRLILLVPLQEYLPYTEDYHLHFFRGEDDLRKIAPLRAAQMERYSEPSGTSSYGGEVMLVISERL